MPFQSQAQMRYLYAKRPDVAAMFAKDTPKGKKLPKHKEKSYSKGAIDSAMKGT